MIVVFNALPIILAGSITGGSITPFNIRATTAAAEQANTVEWLIQTDY
jgi:hypothetical protein